MTYAKTSKVVKAISNLETWIYARESERQSEDALESEVMRFETYAAEARQELFELFAE